MRIIFATRHENKYNTDEDCRRDMNSQGVALGIFVVLFASSVTVLLIAEEGEEAVTKESQPHIHAGDPLFQGEGHDHMNASQHTAGTDNIEQLAFNPLTSPGNAEVSVARSPDGRVYTYQAGWNDMHIVDVTNASDPQVMGVYNDPNTQVLDVKYLEYNGNEYVILQNQLVDSGYADPNIGEWSDPIQVSVTLIDVTDKTNPTYVDSWYDADHPSGPHNLYPHMIDNEWYIFVANPDYEQCNSAIGRLVEELQLLTLTYKEALLAFRVPASATATQL